MDALQSLAAEHRLIRQTLDAFEAYVGYVEARVLVGRLDLQRFLLFFENFVDLHHHDKEETLLFPALVAAGLDWNNEPLARIRREHDQERYLMRSLEHAAQQAEAWSEDGRLHFLGIANEFISFQRSHMRFENTDVFPRAESVLSEEARMRLSRDVQRFDEAVQSRNDHLSELAENLMRRYVLNEHSRCEGTNRVDRLSAGRR